MEPHSTSIKKRRKPLFLESINATRNATRGGFNAFLIKGKKITVTAATVTVDG